jgi:hypothetical protein
MRLSESRRKDGSTGKEMIRKFIRISAPLSTIFGLLQFLLMLGFMVYGEYQGFILQLVYLLSSIFLTLACTGMAGMTREYLEKALPNYEFTISDGVISAVTVFLPILYALFLWSQYF